MIIVRQGDDFMLYIMKAKDIVSGKANVSMFVNNLRYKNGRSVIVCATRASERGVVEPIYIYGSASPYPVGMIDNYTIDTGRGHGGKGRIQITGVIYMQDGVVTESYGVFDIKEKRPWYVFK